MDKTSHFLQSLKQAFQGVVQAPRSHSPLEVRKMNAKHIQELFNGLDVQIKGSEHLPYEQGSIFIYNHINNHPSLLVTEDDFQITLDSHFISSMLYKYYQDPGTRVTRYALPEEKSHQSYYDRLNYIKVYSRDFTPENLDKKVVKNTNKQFYTKAESVLNANESLIFSPEGFSFTTEESPGAFREGIFKLAAGMKTQPKIVPLVIANFDKLPHETTYKCQIMPSFKMSDFGIEDKDDAALPEVVEKINKKYKNWVQKLCVDDTNFEREIAVLKRRVEQHESKDDLIVFYGSSTIRLWEDLPQDFPNHNTLNLGFGGAFIHSLDHYFETLFNGIQPKAIVSYLGGNDLTLGLTATEISEKISAFVKRVHEKFPKTILFNISIKPSFERQENLALIEEINANVKGLARETPYLHQLELYEQLIYKGQIKKDIFLQDGLHFNANGYLILKELVSKALQRLT